MQTGLPFEVKESSIEKIKELLLEESDKSIQGLRVFVQGGGCSGFSYGFTWADIINEDDFVFEQDGIKLMVDSMSSQYLTGSVIDYTSDLAGASFTIKNPTAVSTCGCGSSFSV